MFFSLFASLALSQQVSLDTFSISITSTTQFTETASLTKYAADLALLASPISGAAGILTNLGDGCKAISKPAILSSFHHIALINNNGSCPFQTIIDNCVGLSYRAVLLTQSPPASTSIPLLSLQIPLSFHSELTALLSKYSPPFNSTNSTTFPLNQIEAKIFVGGNNVPGIWEFTLIVVIVLLGLSFMASVIMHVHLWRERQRRMDENAIRVCSEREVEGLEKFVFTGKRKMDSSDVTVVVEGNKQRKDSISASVESKLSIEVNSVRRPSVSSNGVDLCSICLEEYVDGDDCRRLPCGHVYHAACVDVWLTKKSRSCPLCKEEIEESKESEVVIGRAERARLMVIRLMRKFVRRQQQQQERYQLETSI